MHLIFPSSVLHEDRETANFQNIIVILILNFKT
jgi:hypothetical protein